MTTYNGSENKERAYVAASRRTDRSLEARMGSARRASEVHEQRTGKPFHITEAIVAGQEMYEEQDDDLLRRQRIIEASSNAAARLAKIESEWRCRRFEETCANLSVLNADACSDSVAGKRKKMFEDDFEMPLKQACPSLDAGHHYTPDASPGSTSSISIDQGFLGGPALTVQNSLYSPAVAGASCTLAGTETPEEAFTDLGQLCAGTFHDALSDQYPAAVGDDCISPWAMFLTSAKGQRGDYLPLP